MLLYDSALPNFAWRSLDFIVLRSFRRHIARGRADALLARVSSQCHQVSADSDWHDISKIAQLHAASITIPQDCYRSSRLLIIVEQRQQEGFAGYI
jgi:hypothetical protein